jgi:hypothetical protein
LDGSKFGYVIRTSPDDPEGVREVLLSRKPTNGTQPEQSMPSSISQPVMAAQPIVDTEALKDMPEQPSPPDQPALSAAAIEDPHPASPLQGSTSPSPDTDQARQQQDTNRQFMQDLYHARQKLQPQPQSQQDQSSP